LQPHPLELQPQEATRKQSSKTRCGRALQEHDTREQRPDSAAAAGKDVRIRKAANDAPPESRAAVARPQRHKREDWAAQMQMPSRTSHKRLPA